MARLRTPYAGIDASSTRPKLLVVVDETPEFGITLLYAARRALRQGASLLLLAVTATPEGAPAFFGIGDMIREEARALAEERLRLAAERAFKITGVLPETQLKTGKTSEQLLLLIDQDTAVIELILGAGSGKEGPGPLVSLLAGKQAAHLTVPIILVPGGLSIAEIEGLT